MEYSAKRGQTSVENLVLYGLVGISLIITLVALYQMGIFSPYGGKKGFVGFSQVSPTDWVVERTAVYISLENQGDAAILLDTETVNVSIGKLDCQLLTTGDVERVEGGAKVLVNVDCPRINDQFQIGDYFEGDVSFNYTNTATNTMHTSVGKIYGVIEDIGDYETTSSTTTTREVEGECFQTECMNSGEIDEDYCGDISWFGDCTYCFLDPTDGLKKCWYRGRCSEECWNDLDCIDPEYPTLNECNKCVEDLLNPGKFVCKQSNNTDRQTCGPCELRQMGFGDPHCGESEDCEYCEMEWQQFGAVWESTLGYYTYTCETNKSCGLSCADYGFDVYDECEERCKHCEPDPANPGLGICEQGDCGRRCGPGAPIEECEEGCAWCNVTGDNPSYKCEVGDCGKPCGPDDPMMDCELGCDTCYNGRCVNTEIGISLYVHNGTRGKVVHSNDTIVQNATAFAQEDGISQIILSNGLRLAGGFDNASTACYEISDSITKRLKQLHHPDPRTQDWIETDFGITWNSSQNCFGAINCRKSWSSFETDWGTYCFFAAAEKAGTTTRWSGITSDYIQVGFINVYLVYPPPGAGSG